MNALFSQWSYELVSDHINKEEGEVTVTIKAKYFGIEKEYTGCAFCCEEDREEFSRFTGWTIAETRASIKMLKDIEKVQKIRYHAIKKVYEDNIMSHADDIEELRNRVSAEKKMINDIKGIIKHLYFSLLRYKN